MKKWIGVALAEYPVSYGEALVVNSTATNGWMQLIRRGN
jgi:hypothetical protein